MNRGLEVDCQDLVELVTDYLEGTLPAGEREKFEDHLQLCEGCAAYVEQMRDTVVAAGRLRPQALDPGMRGRLLEAFRDWNR